MPNTELHDPLQKRLHLAALSNEKPTRLRKNELNRVSLRNRTSRPRGKGALIRRKSRTWKMARPRNRLAAQLSMSPKLRNTTETPEGARPPENPTRRQTGPRNRRLSGSALVPQRLKKGTIETGATSPHTSLTAVEAKRGTRRRNCHQRDLRFPQTKPNAGPKATRRTSINRVVHPGLIHATRKRCNTRPFTRPIPSLHIPRMPNPPLRDRRVLIPSTSSPIY